nr:T9SS type A sorting domain-containing protein [uncultured Flavobacterium sp.]
MKKTLLYLILPMLFTISSISAQTKVWDFGANAMGAGFTDMITVANQTTCALFTQPATPYGTTPVSTSTIAANATFGTMIINTASGDRFRSDNTALVLYDTQLNNLIGGSVVTPVFTGATTSGRLAFNGGGHKNRRYIIITLAAGQSMTLYWKSNLTSAGNLDVRGPSGSTVTSIAYPVVTATSDMRTSKFTADIAGDYKIGTNLDLTTSTDPIKLELYRIYDADVTAGINLSAEGFEKDASLDVFSIKNQVHVSNVVSETQINVYSITGSLVKSLKTSGNTNFELRNGVYIVNAKSADGEKSVKVIVQ